MGVLYWEPAWVSSSYTTQWGKGSHQENATFFDFNSNAQADGGFKWLREGKSTHTSDVHSGAFMQFDSLSKTLHFVHAVMGRLSVHGVDGKLLYQLELKGEEAIQLPSSLHGLCIISLQSEKIGPVTKSITVYLP